MTNFSGIFYVTAFVIFILISERDGQAIQKTELCLEPPLADAQEHLKLNWQMSGGAYVDDEFISLTPDQANRQGSLWNMNPVVATDWEVQVNFRIRGKGVNLFGDGLAFWYAKEPLNLGPVFGGKDAFSGLGIFLDTFEEPGTPHKHQHPYVSAMVNNGSVGYSHDEDGTYMQLGGCFANVRNQPHITRMAISYIYQILTVYLDVDGFGTWRECFSVAGVHLPISYYFGVSASTGDLSDSHEILSIVTLDMNPQPQVNMAKSRIIPHAEFYQQPKEYAPLITATDPPPIVEEPKAKKAAPTLQKPKSRTDKEDKVPPQEMPSEKSEPLSWKVKLAILLILAIVIFYIAKKYRKSSEKKKEGMEKRMY